MWYVYILQCADDTLYTGITVDLQRRLEEHNGLNALGARYTRSRRPVTLAWFEEAESRAAASSREAAIKKLSRAQKLKLIHERRHALER
jgi:putative endonuclease